MLQVFSGSGSDRTSAISSDTKQTRLCGSQLPPAISSSGNVMTVVMVSDGTVTSRGFQARWDSDQDADCGGRLSGRSGLVSTPVSELVAGNYTNHTWCRWTFVNTDTANSTLVLTTPEYYLERPYNDLYCRYDWLQVTSNGGGQVDTMTRPRQCGVSQSPYIVATPLAETSILFKSDASITDRGFNMTYSISPCGGLLEGPSATLTSPNYPQNYPDNINCYWILRFSEGSQIEIRTSTFALESACDADNVTIRNGGSPDSPVLWSGCGRTVPPTIMSQSNLVTVQFVSDLHNSDTGFNMTAVEHTAGCGGQLHGMAGKVVSPRDVGSTKYPDGVECVWEIMADPGYRAKFQFSGRFDVELTDNCDSDYVEFQFWNDTSNTWTRVSDRKCGRTKPDTVLAPTGRTRIVFRSNRAVNGDGFTIDWSLDCGGIFSTREGSFSSPGYPAQYGNGLNCNYTIANPGQDFIVATFVETFDIEQGRRGCNYDRVEVMDTATNRSRGSYCGGERPAPVSTRGPMTVRFITDGSITKSGFKLSWTTHQCGGHMESGGEIR